ncbi:NAD(P)-binding protein [Artomyces pyxidatus]|uniref:NAD(P)-binding protein n=1 Tax=Artomyces pyxidatus TaxID=48021 RepID=A0ACB8T3V4_9AGAM|nr:NAD(P)-binding protein [Artomyces pyxidatus]
MSKLIVVLGATGKQIQGGSVVDAFLKDPVYRVRAVVRDPLSSSAKALSAKGVEVVQGDLLDVESLKRAFDGANVVYGMTTDLWVNIPAVGPATPERSILEKCYDMERAQGTNIVNAVLPIVDTTLEVFIFSSLSSARRFSKGKYTRVYHFDGKAEVVDMLQRDHPELAAKTAVLQLGLFASNWRGPTPIRPTKQPDGSYEIAAPGSGDALYPLVDPERDTAVFVRALAALRPGRLQTYLGFGEMMSLNTWAALWGRIRGVRAYYKELTVAEYDERITLVPGLGRELGEMYAYSAEFGYDGGEEGVIPMTELELERPVTSMEEYIRNEDWSGLDGAPGS